MASPVSPRLFSARTCEVTERNECPNGQKTRQREEGETRLSIERESD